MTSTIGSETPAVLQLLKWEHSHFQLNLAEFHEAFISPTREQLLLLSYNREAVLLPLVNGKHSKKTLLLIFLSYCIVYNFSFCISFFYLGRPKLMCPTVLCLIM